MTLIQTEKTASQEGYVLDDQVGFILRQVSQRHAAIFQARAVHDLTPTQFAALVRLNQVTSCSQNQLGRLTAMDVATIKGVVDRLNKKGLVVLSADRTDKRRTLISLSDKAAALIADLHRVGTGITRETLQPLTAGEQRTLLALLGKLI